MIISARKKTEFLINSGHKKVAVIGESEESDDGVELVDCQVEGCP